MNRFSMVPNTGIAQLPVVDLITLRPNSEVDQVTASDIYYAQYNWRIAKIYRLDVERRQELCGLLVKLADKLSPELKGTDTYETWKKVSAEPSYPDELFSSIASE